MSLTNYITIPNRTGRELLPHGKVTEKPTDKMDKWLDAKGYYRKHTARDGSCLFRAVSEQVFLTQAFHLVVRRQCLDFILRNPNHFEKALKCTVNEYVEKVRNPNEWGGELEIEAMALMYRRDFIVYQEIDYPAQNVTNHGFNDKILLCFSQDRHYDSVYTKEHITNAAFCQSIVYDMLYKDVFELQEVDYAVKKMLHDKTSQYQHQREANNFLTSGLALRLEMRDNCVNVKDLLSLGVTPFPYKVAKSLDPDIYRNVEYDTWNEYRRGMRFGITAWNNRELQVGVKCLVKLQPEQVCHAHIQEMEPNKGPVKVFVEELGEKLTVPYECLELLPPVKSLVLKVSSSSSSHSPSEDVPEVEEDNEEYLLPLTTLPWQETPKQWSRENSNGRKTPKIKMFSDLQRSNKKNKCGRPKSKEEEANKSAPPVSSTTNSIECSYQQEVAEYQDQDSYENYHNQAYLTQNYETVEQEAVEEHCLAVNCSPPTTLSLEPGTPYYNTNLQPVAYRTMVAQKSVLPDCSDLPFSDVQTLRYFYNYGVDQFTRENRSVHPVSYLPPARPAVTLDSTVAVSPAGFYCSRPESTSVNYESDVLHNNYQLAPRFSNRTRPSNINAECSPLVQQCEVSSSTPTSVPVLPQMPSPVTIYPSSPPQPIYYIPLECDSYCPANYLYNTTPSSVYPAAQPAHPVYSPTTYIPPDTVFYQHVVPPNVQ